MKNQVLEHHVRQFAHQFNYIVSIEDGKIRLNKGLLNLRFFPEGRPGGGSVSGDRTSFKSFTSFMNY